MCGEMDASASERRFPIVWTSNDCYVQIRIFEYDFEFSELDSSPGAGGIEGVRFPKVVLTRHESVGVVKQANAHGKTNMGFVSASQCYDALLRGRLGDRITIETCDRFFIEEFSAGKYPKDTFPQPDAERCRQSTKSPPQYLVNPARYNTERYERGDL